MQCCLLISILPYRLTPVSDRRVIEAARLGYRKIYVSGFSSVELVPDGIEVVKVADVPALCRSLFKGN